MGTLRWADLKLAALTSILVLAAYIGVVQGFNSAHWARNLPETATATALLGCGTLGLFADRPAASMAPAEGAIARKDRRMILIESSRYTTALHLAASRTSAR